MNEWYMWKSLL